MGPEPLRDGLGKIKSRLEWLSWLWSKRSTSLQPGSSPRSSQRKWEGSSEYAWIQKIWNTNTIKYPQGKTSSVKWHLPQFTKLDSSQGLWQLKRDESSSKHCAFSTPFGWFCQAAFWNKVSTWSISQGNGADHRDLGGTLSLNRYHHHIGRDSPREAEPSVGTHMVWNPTSKCEFRVEELLLLRDKLSAQEVQPDQWKKNWLTEHAKTKRVCSKLWTG